MVDDECRTDPIKDTHLPRPIGRKRAYSDEDSDSVDEINVVNPPTYGTRTYLQLVVGLGSGSVLYVQVVIHLRVVDLPWWNHPDSIAAHHRQLMCIIQDQILPTDFQREIEIDGIQRSPRPRNKQDETREKPNSSNTGDNATHSKEKRIQTTNADNLNNKAGVKKKNAGFNKARPNHSKAPKRISKETIHLKPIQVQPTRTDDEPNVPARKYQADFRILMGDTIQITYKCLRYRNVL